LPLASREQPRISQSERTLTWRQRFAAFRSVPEFLRLAWETHRGYAALTVALRLFRSLIPIAALWVAKAIIDAVVTGRNAPAQADPSRLWWLVGLEIVIVVAGEALSKASMVVESLFSDLCSNHLNEKLIGHAAKLDLFHFEDPAFYDKLERAQRQTTGASGCWGSYSRPDRTLLRSSRWLRRSCCIALYYSDC